MSKSLRERQKQMARETILRAVADQVTESGSLDFSIAEIAERAGVSHRTVYNYFGSRPELIGAFSDWVDRAIHESGGTVLPKDLGDLPRAVSTNFQIFEDRSDIAEALARVDTVERPIPARARRSEAFEKVVSVAYPGMEPRAQKMVAVLIRQIASVRTWYHMTREHGLTTTEAAAVSTWALEQLKASLDRGEVPDSKR